MGLVASACSACVCLGSCCCRGTGGVSPRSAKAINFLFLLGGVVVTLLLYRYGDDIPGTHGFFSIKAGCSPDGESSLADCFGLQSVFRISFALAAFYLFSAIASAFSTGFHLHLWGLKFLLWLALIILSFFIPYNFFAGYVQLARVVSVLFLVVQVVILIDFAYKVHEALAVRVERMQSHLEQEYATVGLCQNGWKFIYLGVVLTLLSASCAVLFWLFHFVNKNPVNCSEDKLFLAITFISGVVLTLMSASRYFGQRGTVAPSVLFAYCTWMVWSAMTSNPKVGCAPIQYDGSSKWAPAVGILISTAAFMWMAYSSTSSVPGVVASKSEETKPAATSQSTATPLLTGDGAAAPTTVTRGESKTEHADEEHASSTPGPAKPHADRYWVFHLVMVLGAMYMSMVLSNWQTDANKATYVSNNVDKTTMWLKIASEWIAIVMFAWTLVAPRIFPDRDFS